MHFESIYINVDLYTTIYSTIEFQMKFNILSGRNVFNNAFVN